MLDDVLTSNEELFQEQFYDNNVELIQRLVLTPSGVLYFLKEPEMSSELLRMFKKQILKQQLQFIRLRVQDEEGNTLHNMQHLSKPYLKDQI